MLVKWNSLCVFFKWNNKINYAILGKKNVYVYVRGVDDNQS